MYLKMGTIINQAKAFQTVVEKSHPLLERKNDWGAFSKLSVIIFARSTGFTICNSFIPIFGLMCPGYITCYRQYGFNYPVRPGCRDCLLEVFWQTGWDLSRFCARPLSSWCWRCFSTHSTDVTTATLLLIPAAYALFGCYSPIVVLGQTYSGKNVGFASGVTMGLGTTIGGIMAPLVGELPITGVSLRPLQVLWIAGLAAAIFSFLLPRSKELNKNLILQKRPVSGHISQNVSQRQHFGQLFMLPVLSLHE